VFDEIIKAIPYEPYFRDESADIVIYCGDCRLILPPIPDKSIDLVLTDPPYGIGRKYGNHYDDKRDGYWDWFKPVVTELRRVGKVVAIHHLLFALKEFNTWDWVIAWHKPYGAGARIGHSPILPHWEPILLWGIHSLGVKRDVLQDWISCNPEPSKRRQIGISPRDADNLAGDEHPLPKPEELESKLIAKLSDGGIILDSFVGSGTTLVCAKKLGRRAIGIEIEEKYCEIAAKRLSQSVMRLDV
jgi:site-specific DNA-methyltransferase (adenine-specific)